MARKATVSRNIGGTIHTFLIELSNQHSCVFIRDALVVQVTVTPPLAGGARLVEREGKAVSAYTRSVLAAKAQDRPNGDWIKDALYATWGIDNPSSPKALMEDRQALVRVAVDGRVDIYRA